MKIKIIVNIQMKSMIHCDNGQIRNPHQFIDVQCTHQVPMTVYGVHETMKARTWMIDIFHLSSPFKVDDKTDNRVVYIVDYKADDN